MPQVVLAECKPHFFTKPDGKSQESSDMDITRGQDMDPLLAEPPLGHVPFWRICSTYCHCVMVTVLCWMVMCGLL